MPVTENPVGPVSDEVPKVEETPASLSGVGGAASGGASADAVGGAPGAGGGGGAQQPGPEVIAFTDVKSINYTEGCGVKVQAGSTTVVEAGLAIDMTAYGKEMGFHCIEDNGQFAYIEVTGDFDFEARVDFASTDDGVHHTRTGIMARALPVTNSSAMFVGVSVSSNWTNNNWGDFKNFAVRMVEGGHLVEGPGDGFFYHVQQQDKENHHTGWPPEFNRTFPNEWLRLRRTGNEYMGWYKQATDKDWVPYRRFTQETPQAPEVSWTIDLGETVALGFSLEGSPEHSHTMRGNAKFRDIKITRP